MEERVKNCFHQEEYVAAERIGSSKTVGVFVRACMPDSILLRAEPYSQPEDISVRRLLEMRKQGEKLGELFEQDSESQEFMGMREGWEQTLANILGVTTETYDVVKGVITEEVELDEGITVEKVYDGYQIVTSSKRTSQPQT